MSAPGSETLLFVYGTLRRDHGHPMHEVLARGASFVDTASIGGRLHDLGAYPGAVPASDGPRVAGEVYELHDPPSMLRALDDYEGCGPGSEPPFEFQRGLAEVELDGGGSVSAWTYWYVGAEPEGR